MSNNTAGERIEPDPAVAIRRPARTLLARMALGWVAAFILSAPPASAENCGPKGVSVQILGSGGPVAGGSRASSSYLVWIDGRARLLIDVGGGSFVRFGEATARLADLFFVGITHLHPDHVADLAALLWLSDGVRVARLPIAGPSGNASDTSMSAFCRRLVNGRDGAFPMLARSLGGSVRGVPLDVTEVDVERRAPSTVFDAGGVTVTAVGVPHGGIPALAYRVRAGQATIVFSGDQIGTTAEFLALAKGADVLIMHMAVGAGDRSPGHASPATIGRVARDAHAARLILSHLGPGLASDGRSLQPEVDNEPAVAEVKQYYQGPLSVGIDLQCASVR